MARKYIILTNGHETIQDFGKEIITALELHGMYDIQSEFIIHSTFRSESKIFKVQLFNKTGSTNNMESASDNCS